jgi:hypothetical protein
MEYTLTGSEMKHDAGRATRCTEDSSENDITHDNNSGTQVSSSLSLSSSLLHSQHQNLATNSHKTKATQTFVSKYRSVGQFTQQKKQELTRRPTEQDARHGTMVAHTVQIQSLRIKTTLKSTK